MVTGVSTPCGVWFCMQPASCSFVSLFRLCIERVYVCLRVEVGLLLLSEFELEYVGSHSVEVFHYTQILSRFAFYSSVGMLLNHEDTPKHKYD